MGHKATPVFLHLDLSCATCCASAQVRPISVNFVITVLLQVVFGLPHFLSGVVATYGQLLMLVLALCYNGV